MVIFGVTLVLALRNLKCSSIGWSAEKSILPVTRSALGLGLHALELDALLGLVRSRTPGRCSKKSKCHQERRNSPSVASLQADLLLLLDDLPDLLVLDGLELRGRDLALLALGARLLQRGGAQQAADLVGADRGRWRAWALLLSRLVLQSGLVVSRPI